MTRAVELAVKRCHSETDAGEEDADAGEEGGADLTGAVQEGGNVMQDVAREEDNDGGLAESLHPGVAECVQENVAVNPGKKVEIVAREGREVRAKEGKREVWVVKKDLKGRVQKRKVKYGLWGGLR